jgi:hypothetical protein
MLRKLYLINSFKYEYLQYFCIDEQFKGGKYKIIYLSEGFYKNTLKQNFFN